jgi:superfamily II DNA helicase RecQ
VYQLIVASLEYIAEDSRFLCLWRSSAFTSRVKRLIFDEAHCISQWGDFRKTYKNLCFLRYIMPTAVVLVLSATLPPLILTEIQSLLGLPHNVPIIRHSNDRHNISLIVHQMQHTLRSLHNLAFLFPLGFNSSSQPPRKFMVFMETKDLCQRATRFLWQRLPQDQKNKVVWVHVDMSCDHNQKALAQLRAGEIYGIVCTDVAGMVSYTFLITLY